MPRHWPVLRRQECRRHRDRGSGIPRNRLEHDVARRYTGFAKLLGDPRHGLPYFEAIIREHSQDPERELALLDERARQMLEEMRQIQLEVTGSSTIGG